MNGRRVLQDENLSHKLRLHLPQHEVVTVAFAEMDGLKNGELLKAAEGAGFDVFLTADKALPHQQNIIGQKDRDCSSVRPNRGRDPDAPREHF